MGPVAFRQSDATSDMLLCGTMVVRRTWSLDSSVAWRSAVPDAVASWWHAPKFHG